MLVSDLADGSKVAFDAEKGLKVTTFPNGRRVITAADGTTTYMTADGKIVQVDGQAVKEDASLKIDVGKLDAILNQKQEGNRHNVRQQSSQEQQRTLSIAPGDSGAQAPSVPTRRPSGASDNDMPITHSCAVTGHGVQKSARFCVHRRCYELRTSSCKTLQVWHT